MTKTKRHSSGTVAAYPSGTAVCRWTPPLKGGGITCGARVLCASKPTAHLDARRTSREKGPTMKAVTPQATRSVEFFVPGRAAPQGSKRHVGRGVLIESSRDVGPWRERVALAARRAMNGRPLFDTAALAVDIRFVMPRPASTPKHHTPAAIKRPDLDKLVRAVLDALTHTVFADDSLLIDLRARKRLAEAGEPPGAQIAVTQALIEGGKP